MTEDIRANLSEPKPPGETGAILLTATGLAAAFGAASCCALPVLLGSVGLGSAWLGSLALIAGPYRAVLLAAAVVCLVSGGGLLLWGRRVATACAPGSACGRSAATGLITGALTLLGAILTVFGFIFA